MRCRQIVWIFLSLWLLYVHLALNRKNYFYWVCLCVLGLVELCLSMLWNLIISSISQKVPLWCTLGRLSPLPAVWWLLIIRSPLHWVLIKIILNQVKSEHCKIQYCLKIFFILKHHPHRFPFHHFIVHAIKLLISLNIMILYIASSITKLTWIVLLIR